MGSFKFIMIDHISIFEKSNAQTHLLCSWISPWNHKTCDFWSGGRWYRKLWTLRMAGSRYRPVLTCKKCKSLYRWAGYFGENSRVAGGNHCSRGKSFCCGKGFKINTSLWRARFWVYSDGRCSSMVNLKIYLRHVNGIRNCLRQDLIDQIKCLRLNW